MDCLTRPEVAPVDLASVLNTELTALGLLVLIGWYGVHFRVMAITSPRALL